MSPPPVRPPLPPPHGRASLLTPSVALFMAPSTHAYRAHYHCSSGRAALDAMVRTEFLNIFTPAELAAHREARDGEGWPLVDHMRGKVHISP